MISATAYYGATRSTIDPTKFVAWYTANPEGIEPSNRTNANDYPQYMVKDNRRRIKFFDTFNAAYQAACDEYEEQWWS